MRRPNKIAAGCYKTDNRRKGNKSKLSNAALTLNVRGTLDHLAATNFKIKKVKIEHPIDKGYYKEAYILSEMGKKRLKTMKSLKRGSLPLWDYMYTKVS